MHEVAIAAGLVDALLATAARHGLGRVAVARLDVGRLTGVEPDTLRFAFEVACRGTAAEGCALEIRDVLLAVRCRACGLHEERAEPMAPCSGCGARAADVLRGRELRIASMDAE